MGEARRRGTKAERVAAAATRHPVPNRAGVIRLGSLTTEEIILRLARIRRSDSVAGFMKREIASRVRNGDGLARDFIHDFDKLAGGSPARCSRNVREWLHARQ